MFRAILAALMAFAVLAPLTAPAQSITRVNSYRDGSGTLTAGGTSQQVFPVDASRTYLMCQNPITATETLFINFGATASTTAGSIELAAGGTISFHGSAVPTTTVNVNAATTGHRFVCKAGVRE